MQLKQMGTVGAEGRRHTLQEEKASLALSLLAMHAQPHMGHLLEIQPLTGLLTQVPLAI